MLISQNKNAIMLDASKAFDRVYYVKLLLKREVCPVVLRFLIELYTNQKLRIKWGFTIPELFCIKMVLSKEECFLLCYSLFTLMNS